jgi:2,3,4,5-tetrahydropyridine-2-carboxylate N-succinyltransferase
MREYDVDLKKLQSTIEHIEQSLGQGKGEVLKENAEAVHALLKHLDEGTLRVCTREGDDWVTHAWIKQGILHYFRMMEMKAFEVGPFHYYDKIPLKTNYEQLKVRVVPPATARYGSFMEPGVVLMPSYVNIGAFVGKNTMVDTWATVGSCAQIGANVHLSGGVGIGGVLEPAHAKPVIVGDGAFIGSRAIVVEGVQIGAEAVLAANVTLTASTPIIDIRDGKFVETKGFIPDRAVVLPGTKEKQVPGGVIHTACAYIIGNRKASTDLKTSLNDTLREFAISV